MGIGGGELLIILLIVLLLFGPGKIPEIAKTIGKGMNEFKRAADEIKNEIVKEESNIRTNVNDEVRTLKNSVSTSYKEEDETPTKSESTSTKKGGGKSSSIVDLSEGSGI